jgi:hypothetical protein
MYIRRYDCMDESLDDSWTLGYAMYHALLASRVAQAFMLQTAATSSINLLAIDKGDMV